MKTQILQYDSKANLERKHKIKVYIHWKDVPIGLISKTDAVKKKVFNPECKPAAIKLSIVTKSAYFLYDFSNQESK